MIAPSLRRTGLIGSLLEMLEFSAASFVGLSSWLTQMQMAYLSPAAPGSGGPGKSPLDPEQLDLLKAEIARASDMASSIRLNRFVDACSELISCIGDPRDPALAMLKNYIPEIAVRLGQLCLTLKTDLNALQFAAIEPRHVAYYQATTPLMGNDVHQKFPESTFDIEEAGKCLALGRFTACVSHLMRAAEAATAVALRHLGGDPNKEHDEVMTFGELGNAIEGRIKSLKRGITKDRWEAVKIQIFAVNRAYRTKVAHPVDKYTEKEAEVIFASTRSLLEEIASLT